jgi:2-polyprenyl-6-methoxyphenol hydroxylase-like FAD-dependent oxidoreductase
MSQHAEIAGAGIAGLTAAAALAKRGWSVRVHEREEELREIGSGISLRENGLRALETVGAFEEAVEGGERIRRWDVFDERLRTLSTGEPDESSRFFTVERSRLHAALSRAAERAGVEIVTGSRVSGADPAGALLLEGGERLEADVVIGADGIGSAVRGSLGVEARVNDLEYVSQRVLIPRTEADAHGSFPGYWNGSHRIAVAGCGARHMYVFMFCRPDDTEAWATPLRRDIWIASFPHLKHVIERIPSAGEWREIWEVVCRPWHRGRVALIGDAAHAMAPTLGQGACLAMESGVALASVLPAAGDPGPALARWEAAQRPVIDATQRYGRTYIKLLTRWPRPLLDARSAFMWGFARSPRVRRRLAGTPAATAT